MSYFVPVISLERAIRHIVRYGDTDVFPHLPELVFLREEASNVAKELSELDLENYEPGNAVEALGPKSRFGFRIVHQLNYLDTILFLSAVIEIGGAIEQRRLPSNEIQAFSYRFSPDDKGAIFSPNHTYKEWLKAQIEYVENNLKVKHIVATDISDFYARINFHRLENLLDEAAPSHGAAKYIKRHIKRIRARQSFGLPVGGSASRLLAELSLTDTDTALMEGGHVATRFVDDYRIFLEAGDDPYDALAFAAEQLGISEGLSLNVAKTKVSSRTEFLDHLDHLITDVSDEAEGAALEALTSDLYFDDEPNPEELEELQSLNLLGFLRNEVGKDSYDIGRIKVIFRALKIARPLEAVPYLITNFSELVVFAKEMTLLMQVLERDNPGCFDELTDQVIEAVLRPPAASIQLIKTWLLELFVRGTVPIAANALRRLDNLNSPLDRRQLHLVRGRIGDINFFRRNKTAFDLIPELERTCFVWGASCLPDDEYRAWLMSIKRKFGTPTGSLFVDWVRKNKPDLISKMDSLVDDGSI